MKMISSHISFSEEKKASTLVILPESSFKQRTIFLLWLVAWTMVGLAVLIYLAQGSDPDLRTGLFFFMAFWSYVEFIALRGIIWRFRGFERLEITDEHVRFHINIWPRPVQKTLGINSNTTVETIPRKPSDFLAYLDQSIWSVKGDTLKIEGVHQTFQFGKQLSRSDQKKVVKILSKTIRQWSKK